MKKLLTLVVLLLICILMTLTRPNKETHKEAMMKAVNEYVEEEMKAGMGINMLAKLGKNVIVRTVSVLLDTQLEEHNYYLFNTTSAKIQGEEKILSVGILGHVFTFDKDMLREKMEPLLKSKAGQSDKEQ